MSLGFRNIDGVSWAQANDSIKIADIPGDGGSGPIGFVIQGGASGLPPNNAGIGFQLFPGGNFADGTDSLGNIGTEVSAFNSGDDINFNVVGGGTFTFPNGFWASSVRSIVTGNKTGLSNFAIQFSYSNPVLVYDQTINETPHNPHGTNVNWDGTKGTVDLSIDFDNSMVVNPTAIQFLRNGDPLAAVPWVDGITTYTFQDVIFTPGTYDYTAVVYKYGSPNTVSLSPTPISINFGGFPSFDITGEGGFDLGGTALFGFLVNPSGIYKLTINKTHDTVYLDSSSSANTIDVAFPDPIIVTFFAGK